MKKVSLTLCTLVASDAGPVPLQPSAVVSEIRKFQPSGSFACLAPCASLAAD